MRDHIDKTGCDFSSDVAGFIYDEISPAAKSRVQEHLRSCDHCSQEVAALSAARLSIHQWRQQTLAGMDTPVIVLPRRVLQNTNTGSFGQWISWLLRPPVLAAFTALVVIALAVIVQFRPAAVEIAQDLEVDRTTQSIITAQDKVVNESDTAREILVAPVAPKAAAADGPARAASAPTPKASRKAPSGARAKASKGVNSIPSDRSVATDAAKLPQLSDFVENEDQTLLLSDLLSEVEPG